MPDGLAQVVIGNVTHQDLKQLLEEFTNDFKDKDDSEDSGEQYHQIAVAAGNSLVHDQLYVGGARQHGDEGKDTEHKQQQLALEQARRFIGQAPEGQLFIRRFLFETRRGLKLKDIAGKEFFRLFQTVAAHAAGGIVDGHAAAVDLHDHHEMVTAPEGDERQLRRFYFSDFAF